MSDVHNGQPACPLNVRAEQLSALYDDDLSGDADALRQHIATCNNCQSRLRDYARIREALSGQMLPAPGIRLKQSVLTAREQMATAPRRALAPSPLWRTLAAAAAVILIVGGFVGILLSHASMRRSATAPTVTPDISTATRKQLTGTSTVPYTASAPPGWSAVLPLRRFSFGGAQGFAVSAARPDRLIGCGTLGAGTDGWPYPTLAISDDGGQTWQESDIQAIGMISDCAIVVDQRQPDTIVVGDTEAKRLAVTTDAGKTWRALHLPSGMGLRFAQGGGYAGPTLVNGHLIGIFRPLSGSGRWTLGDLSITGAYKVLDATLPYPNSATLRLNTPMAFAVDPSNAAHVYAIVPGKWDPAHPSQDVLLYATLDGGATWRRVYTFSYGERISLWAPTPTALYVWISYPEMSRNGNPLLQSVDGGATWRPVTPSSVAVADVLLSPSGRIVLGVDVAGGPADMLEGVDPRTGKLTPIGQAPSMSTSGSQGLVTDGAHPVLIFADGYVAYVRPLP